MGEGTPFANVLIVATKEGLRLKGSGLTQPRIRAAQSREP
jgi:hypothetical protein